MSFEETLDSRFRGAPREECSPSLGRCSGVVTEWYGGRALYNLVSRSHGYLSALRGSPTSHGLTVVPYQPEQVPILPSLVLLHVQRDAFADRSSCTLRALHRILHWLEQVDGRGSGRVFKLKATNCSSCTQLKWAGAVLEPGVGDAVNSGADQRCGSPERCSQAHRVRSAPMQ